MGRRIRGLNADERRAERRDLLLDSGLDLFARNGYLGTSIEQLCATAYVGTKSFYELFESREACYLALLQRTSERLQDTLATAAQEATGNERIEAPRLLNVFVHALVDDPRVARVTFGMAAGISPEVERQRRTNRRWAARFLEQLWNHYDALPAGPDDPDRRAFRYSVAIGLVGGLFDLISDWLLDADLAAEDQVERLIDDMTSFYITVRRGLGTG